MLRSGLWKNRRMSLIQFGLSALGALVGATILGLAGGFAEVFSVRFASLLSTYPEPPDPLCLARSPCGHPLLRCPLHCPSDHPPPRFALVSSITSIDRFLLLLLFLSLSLLILILIPLFVLSSSFASSFPVSSAMVSSESSRPLSSSFSSPLLIPIEGGFLRRPSAVATRISRSPSAGSSLPSRAASRPPSCSSYPQTSPTLLQCTPPIVLSSFVSQPEIFAPPSPATQHKVNNRLLTPSATPA